MPTNLSISFDGEELVLRADKTLFWPRLKILMAADLHAGKAMHMRKHGLAIPAGSLVADLNRLQNALTETRAERLVLLGDLFHSEPNDEWAVFADWCHRQTAAIELVKGNHDRFLTSEMLTSAGLAVFSEPHVLEPFSLRHHPSDQGDNELPVIAGHVHPVTWLRGPAKDRLRFPCFWWLPNQLILPAFGSLTGGFVIHKSPQEHRYACASDFSTIISLD